MKKLTVSQFESLTDEGEVLISTPSGVPMVIRTPDDLIVKQLPLYPNLKSLLFCCFHAQSALNATAGALGHWDFKPLKLKTSTVIRMSSIMLLFTKWLKVVLCPNICSPKMNSQENIFSSVYHNITGNCIIRGYTVGPLIFEISLCVRITALL